MQDKWLDAFMDTAERFAQLSSSRRLQCGAVIVKDNRIISIGYNGTPTGWDNNCEDEVFYEREWQGYPSIWRGTPTLVTKPEVLHAETNAIAKVARSADSCEGAVMFSTHMPCMECAKLIYQSGIKSVYYRHKYRKEDGINFLQKCGVAVNELDIPGTGARDST